MITPERIDAALQDLVDRIHNAATGGIRMPKATAGELLDMIATLSAKPIPQPSVVMEVPSDWLQSAATIYGMEIGLPAYGRLGKALKPLVLKHGWPEVEKWWRCYCQNRPYLKRNGAIHGDEPGDGPHNLPAKDTRFVSPEDFVRTYQRWREECGPVTWNRS